MTSRVTSNQRSRARDREVTDPPRLAERHHEEGAEVPEADVVGETDGTVVTLSKIGKVTVPPLDHLAWYAGVGALTALELVEWPIAVILVVGKALADNQTHRTLRSLGKAMEDAG